MIGRAAGPVVIQETGERFLDQVFVADTWWLRFCGLQFQHSLPARTGLLLRPCSSIHTFWLRFAIDVLYLDSAGRVLRIVQGVRPWRLSSARCPGVTAVLEVPAGSAVGAEGRTLLLPIVHRAGNPRRAAN